MIFIVEIFRDCSSKNNGLCVLWCVLFQIVEFCLTLKCYLLFVTITSSSLNYQIHFIITFIIKYIIIILIFTFYFPLISLYHPLEFNVSHFRSYSHSIINHIYNFDSILYFHLEYVVFVEERKKDFLLASTFKKITILKQIYLLKMKGKKLILFF